MGKGKEGAAECCLLCGGIACCTIFVAVVLALLGLGIAKIVMGAIYLHECSIERMIPIYLIVGGVVPLLFSGSGRKKDDNDRSFGAGDFCGLIAFLFQVAWLICGSVWVYPNYGKVMSDDFVPCSANVATDCTQGDCNKNFLTFAFAMVTIDWIFFALGIVIVGAMVYTACRR